MRHVIFLNGIWPTIPTRQNTRLSRSISCYQLKHWLSHFNFKSQVIDYCQYLSEDEIFDLLEHFVSKETLAIGVSTTFWSPNRIAPTNLVAVIARVREKWPHIKIISGGARTTYAPELFDKTFIGDSENQLVEWLQSLANKSSLLNKKFNITTLAHRFNEDDAIMEGEALPIELGRGCIFKCKFCAHQNLGKPKFTYQRHFDLILDEIKYNYEKFGTTKYMFLDDTINEDVEKIENLATIKERTGIDIEWTGYLRADLVWARPGSADLLVKSGMRSCFFGVETFHPGAGKSIDKGWGSKHGKEYLPKLYKDIWGEKVNIHVNLIAGLPHETIASLGDSLQWSKENPMGCTRFVPLTLYVEKNDPYAVSEFTRNYADYGYRNVSNATGFWESDTMNSIQADEFCRKANGQLFPQNKVSSWEVFIGTNAGYTTDEVMSWNYGAWEQRVIRVSEDFRLRYIAKLKAINT